MPLHSVFWAYLGICAVALAAVLVSRRPSAARTGRSASGPGSPPRRRSGRPLIGAGLGVFAAFTVLGLFSSLVPTFLHGILGVHNLALIGGASFLIFMTAAVSQAVSARMAELAQPWKCRAAAAARCPSPRSNRRCSPRPCGSSWWAPVAGGVAVGFIFRGGLSELNRLARSGHRAAVVPRSLWRPTLAWACLRFSSASSPWRWGRRRERLGLGPGRRDRRAGLHRGPAHLRHRAYPAARRRPCDGWCSPAEPPRISVPS